MASTEKKSPKNLMKDLNTQKKIWKRLSKKVIEHVIGSAKTKSFANMRNAN